MFGIPDWAIGVGVIILFGAVGIALLVRLLPREHLRAQGASARELAQTVAELRERLGGVQAVQTRFGELEDLRRRLADVEERLDFAERVLTKQRDAGRIAPPAK